MPPSKNSPSRNSLLPLLSSNAHGDFVVFVLTIAQNSSPAPAARATGFRGGRENPQVRVTAVAFFAARRFFAFGVPFVDRDRRRTAAVAEVADHQDVAGPVDAGEVGPSTACFAAGCDFVLEEPEALLSVAAVVVAVRAEEEHVAARGSFGSRTRGFATDRVDRQRVAGGEAVQQVVLVGHRTFGPQPLGDVFRVLRAAAREGRFFSGPAPPSTPPRSRRWCFLSCTFGAGAFRFDDLWQTLSQSSLAFGPIGCVALEASPSSWKMPVSWTARALETKNASNAMVARRTARRRLPAASPRVRHIYLAGWSLERVGHWRQSCSKKPG